MANITRKHHKIFAGSATNNGQFGSAQLGTKINSNDPDVIQALSAYDQGWNSATTGGTELPTLEEMQGLQFNNSYQLAYLLQKGIPEWNTNADYHIGDITREVAGTKLYKSITNDNIGNALSDVANWEFLGNFGLATTTTQGISYLNKPITIANNSTDANNDIDFSAGNSNFDDGSGQAEITALTKQLDAAWSAGNNAGGLDTGTKANSTWYYCYLIFNPTTGASDALFTATYGSPTMPSGYTKKSYRGAIKTDGSGNILPFFYRKNKWFDWGGIGQILDYSASKAVNTTTPNIPISAPPYSMARLLVKVYGGNATSVLLNATDQTISIADTAASATSPIGNLGDQSNAAEDVAYANLEIFTGANGQIQFGTGNFAASITITILTKGWIDNNIID